MELITIVRAQNGLQKLIVQDLPLVQAYQVMKLVEQANIHLTFYSNEMVKCYGDENRIKELNDLNITDFDEREKIRIPLNTNISLTPSDIKFLEPFIDFYEEETP